MCIQQVVDFTDLYKGSVECVKVCSINLEVCIDTFSRIKDTFCVTQGRLKRRELVVPDGGILLRSVRDVAMSDVGL